MWSLWHKTQIGKPKARALRLQGMLRSVWWHSGAIKSKRRGLGLQEWAVEPIPACTTKAPAHIQGGETWCGSRHAAALWKKWTCCMSCSVITDVFAFSASLPRLRWQPQSATGRYPYQRWAVSVFKHLFMVQWGTSCNTGTHCSADFAQNCYSLLSSRCGSALPLLEKNIFLC